MLRMAWSRTSIVLAALGVAGAVGAAGPRQGGEVVTREALAPADPGSPAVVLEKRAELHFAHGFAQPRSTLDVLTRIKILTPAGKAFGQVAIGHGPGLELAAFDGRTVGADGSSVALPADAIFHQDQVGERRVTKVAFPAVDVGSIVEYRYRLAWQAPIFPDPWFFDDRIPVLASELVYHQPPGMRITHHLRETGRGQYRVSREETAAGGQRVSIALEDLPPVPDEPFGFPFADLAHAAWLVTERAAKPGGGSIEVASSWKALVASYVPGFQAARRFGRQARRQARRLVADVHGTRERALGITRFVRDHIRTQPGSLRVGEGASVDAVLRDQAGTNAEVALLLSTMLDAAGVPAYLVWAGDWRDGEPQTEIVRAGWFSKTLVAVKLERGWLYLDPSDRRLAAGRLAPMQEGTEALVLESPAPRRVTLPKTPATDNARHSRLDLTLGEDGRLRGFGSMVFSGHHAWFFLRRREGLEAVAEGWQRWLSDQVPGFTISLPEVDERLDEARLVVSWTMIQQAADVLGDESSLLPSRPFGPLKQRYALDPGARLTPVRVAFADDEQVDLRVTWPASWQLDLVPDSLSWHAQAGLLRASVELDEAQHRLHYRRVVRIDDTVFYPGEGYASLRDLYAELERHDAQPLVLVARP